jgi:crotonobetaine/carnitine-CoA ligase
MLDEVPVAFVIPVPGVAVEGNAELPAAIMAACQAQLADFKRPRQVILVGELPRSTLEKVSKVELRKRLPSME